ELPPGGVKPLRYFGRDLVLFRTQSGTAHVLDAHCPHMGAHLGHGGQVDGERLVCPFHAWKFDGCGQCTSIPYARKVPPKARVAPWPVVEVNGLVMVWFHPEGQVPDWDVPAIPEWGSDEWTPYQKRSWRIKTHNQEMGENSVDQAHFLYVHGTAEMPSTTAE